MNTLKKALISPLYFDSHTDKFARQLSELKKQLSDEIEFLEPCRLGDGPGPCDAVIFPEILGEAYRSLAAFKALEVPILIVTSEFATVSMWDWEIADYLRTRGVRTFCPYSLEETKMLLRMLSVKKTMASSRFLIFQDTPGDGFQPDIFKSFYWWEDECTRSIESTFGVSIEYRSLSALGKKASGYSDADARTLFESWGYPVSSRFSTTMGIESAKLYMALADEIDSDDIIGMGTNCLNESALCASTPCIAWDRLLTERGMMWACEGDTVTLASIYLLSKALQKPLMMTNIYPFLMGQAALKHEKIPAFPELVEKPEDHILLAHCGYFGLLPQSMSCSFRVDAPVLGIVDEQAHVFDARMKKGKVTVSKLDNAMSRLMNVPAELKGYIQYDSSSDCRNGGVIAVRDGRAFMDRVYSHHIILIEGDVTREIEQLAAIMGLESDSF